MLHNHYKEFLQDILTFLPKSQVYTDPLRTLGWGTDASFYRLIPQVVIRSDGESQMVKIIQACKRHRLPYTFRAAGTSLSGQSLSDSVLIVAGKNWEHYSLNDDASVISMQPGLVGGAVNRILKPFGRVLPPDPASVNSAMIGGIVNNNASGMNCGVHANSDRMLISARLILTDGTILDTGSEESKAAFRKSHPDFLKRLVSLRDRVRSNEKLSERIQYKYSIKNVTGLNLRPLVAYDDPFDIIAHLIVGSEGTLAFLSEVRMHTLMEYPYRASAMVYFLTMEESCHAVVALKGLEASEDDEKLSAERLMVKSAEMLDYKSLSAVQDPVYLRYKADVDAGRIAGVAPGDYHNLTAILTETKATTHEELLRRIETIGKCLQKFQLYQPATFTEDPKEYGKYWAIRSGIFPQVGGTRPVGTSCLIEDVAFHIEDLPKATVELQKLIADHGYKDACIYGHAFEGNYHFILNQSFQSETEVRRYEAMMRDVTRLVIEKFDGSLKAEHGTGRNMAPFVKYEWGEEAYNVMVEIKQLFDPEGLLNPGVIFNDDPECFIKHLKPLPVLSFDYDGLSGKVAGETAQSMIKEVKKANKCIECGFCEVNCVSCGFTLSSRMRIAIQREICSLMVQGDNPERLHELERLYRYYGDTTCAADGLCATSCPMKIDTGELTHLIRQTRMLGNKAGYRVGDFAARHLAGVKDAVRSTLVLADVGHSVLGLKMMTAVCNCLHRLGVPLWTVSIPKKAVQPTSENIPSERHELKVVYLPSCINQTMGLPKGAPVSRTVVQETVNLLNKAGYEVIFPENMNRLCCGQIWESKGMLDIADRKTAELEQALMKASENGRYPVLCDQSPCLHRMRKAIKGNLHLYEPVEFILKFLTDKLDFHPIERSIAVHITCSMREMGLTEQIVELAKMCSTHVLVPEGVGCCAFAGDKGFTHPELNRYALRKLKPQVERKKVVYGYSNSRTCEIGLQTNSGVPYMSIVYLVNECTTRR